MATSCRCLLCLNTIGKKGNGNKLPLPSLLQHHYRRRQQHIAIIFFFVTPPQKKTTAHYRLLFLLKPKEYKTHKKTTKTKSKRSKGAYLQAPVLSFHIWPSFVPFYFKRFLLVSFSSQAKLNFSSKKEKKKKRKKNHK